MIPSLRSNDRGQTLNDFALGMSLFFIVLGFTLAFIPQIMAPFMHYGQSGVQTQSERGATQLVGSVLNTQSTADAPTTLNSNCTVAFFNGVNAPGCSYDGGSLKSVLSLRTGEYAHVTVTNPSTGNIVTLNGQSLNRGKSVGASSNSKSESRIVQLNGNVYRLTVTVW